MGLYDNLGNKLFYTRGILHLLQGLWGDRRPRTTELDKLKEFTICSIDEREMKKSEWQRLVTSGIGCSRPRPRPVPFGVSRQVGLKLGLVLGLR